MGKWESGSASETLLIIYNLLIFKIFWDNQNNEILLIKDNLQILKISQNSQKYLNASCMHVLKRLKSLDNWIIKCLFTSQKKKKNLYIILLHYSHHDELARSCLQKKKKKKNCLHNMTIWTLEPIY